MKFQVLPRSAMRRLVIVAIGLEWLLPTFGDQPKCEEAAGDPLLRGPLSDEEAPAWRAHMLELREACESKYTFTSSALDQPGLQWAQTSYVQTQMHPYDRYFYDETTGNYTIDRFLSDLNDRYGGIDSLLLWPTYTNLGADDRNQFDMFRALPGGVSSLKRVVAELQHSGVRVLLPYNPWDTQTRREHADDANTLAQLIADVGADGFNGDTMNEIPKQFYDAGVARGLQLAIEPEEAGTPSMANYTVLHWGYWGQPPSKMWILKLIAHHLEKFELDMVWDILGQFAPLDRVPGVEFFKWTNDARHMTHACWRFSSNRTDYLQVSFFNGIGTQSWENVWGIWNQMTDRDAEALKRSAAILRYFGGHGYLQSQDWQPHSVAKQPSDAVYVSEFPRSPHDRVFLAVNRAGRPASAVLTFPSASIRTTLRYYDCYRGQRLDAEQIESSAKVSVMVETGGFGCVLATNSPPPKLEAFLSSMAKRSVIPLTNLSADRIVLRQTMVTPTKQITRTVAPSGMVEVPYAEAFSFRVSGTEIEPVEKGYFGAPNLPDWAFRLLAGRVPVDVQFPWEHAPTKWHKTSMEVPRFFLHRHPVSVRDYAAYLDASGYIPADQHNWLKNWDHSTRRPRPPHGNPPVTYISLREARAYCSFYGHRLPHDWEWQYAAQGLDGRRYPWGNVDDPSRRPHVVSNGTLPQAEDVGSYPHGASRFGVEDLVGFVWQFTDEFFDNHTRAVLVRGGSYYQPQAKGGVNWYFPNYIQLDRHSKYFLMSDSYERCGTIGFRCAADADQSHSISFI